MMFNRSRPMVLLAAFLWAFVASPLQAEERRRPVRRSPDLYIGKVQVAVAYNLSPESLEEARVNEAELLDLGLRLVGTRLEADPVPASGFRVIIGDQNVMVRDDGSFTILPVPPEVTQGEVNGKDGALTATFAVADHIGPLGSNPTPIVIPLELSDGPNLMNEWDEEDTSRQIAAHEHLHHAQEAIEPSGVCPSAAPCRVDANCPKNPSTCCLDYNGLCANGSRHFAKPGQSCKLRFLQFTGST